MYASYQPKSRMNNIIETLNCRSSTPLNIWVSIWRDDKYCSRQHNISSKYWRTCYQSVTSKCRKYKLSWCSNFQRCFLIFFRQQWYTCCPSWSTGSCIPTKCVIINCMRIYNVLQNCLHCHKSYTKLFLVFDSQCNICSCAIYSKQYPNQ